MKTLTCTTTPVGDRSVRVKSSVRLVGRRAVATRTARGRVSVRLRTGSRIRRGQRVIVRVSVGDANARLKMRVGARKRVRPRAVGHGRAGPVGIRRGPRSHACRTSSGQVSGAVKHRRFLRARRRRRRRVTVVRRRGDRLVLAGVHDLHCTGDLVAGSHGRLEVPVRVQERGAGPGRSSATIALRMPLVTPPWTMISPNGEAAAASSS